MTRYGIAKREGGDLLFVSAGDSLLAFDHRIDAEDYADLMDEPGEWGVHPIPEGARVLVVT